MKNKARKNKLNLNHGEELHGFGGVFALLAGLIHL